MSCIAKATVYLLALTTIAAQAAPSLAADRTDINFSWEGYRVAHYRSPTPEQAEGGQRIDAQQLVQMLDNTSPGPVLLDVQPVRWQSGIFLVSQPRLNLPGSTWLPNVGLGELDQHWSEYFRHHLQRLTNSDKDFPVVVYCTADCWMSWNAVKRAHDWGYTNLYWFAEGSDGWREADRALTTATPEPLPDWHNPQDTDRPDTTR